MVADHLERDALARVGVRRDAAVGLVLGEAELRSSCFSIAVAEAGVTPMRARERGGVTRGLPAWSL